MWWASPIAWNCNWPYIVPAKSLCKWSWVLEDMWRQKSNYFWRKFCIFLSNKKDNNRMFYRRLKPSFGGEGSNEFGPMPDGQSQSYHTLLAPNCQAMMKISTPAVCCKLRDAVGTVGVPILALWKPIEIPIGSMVLVYIYILTLGVYWWDPCYHIYHTWIRHGIGNSSLNCFRTSTGRSGVRMPHFEMFLALEMPLLCLSINMVVKNKWSCRDAVAQWFMSFHWNMDPHHIIYTSIDHQLYRHSSLPSGKLT